MTKCKLLLPLLLAPWLVAEVVATPLGDGPIELDHAEVFIEYNSTDGDRGIQFFWDGEPWKNMRVKNPGQRPVLTVNVRKNLKEQGLTEGFFESAEPDEEDLSEEEFFERFPEGVYEFRGKGLEGDGLAGSTVLTHTLPAPPSNLWPAHGDAVDASLPLTVSFDAVTEDIDGDRLEPELYEVVVETENDDILQVLSVILRGDTVAPAVTVPAEWLVADCEYKFEVIVQEESGNRTISETEFTTLP